MLGRSFGLIRKVRGHRSLHKWTRGGRRTTPLVWARRRKSLSYLPFQPSHLCSVLPCVSVSSRLTLPKNMRILIQDPESKSYYGGVHWVTNLGDAKDFETV